MNKSSIILFIIFVAIILIEALVFNLDLQDQDKVIAELQAQLQQPQTIEAQYTMITNLSSVMYINSVKVPTEALRWTDVNGISGFDISIGNTHYRYIEGHIEGKQLMLYAPYLYVEENIFE